MSWRLNPYALSLILTTLVPIGAIIYALRHRHTHRAVPFTWLMGILAFWTLSSGFELGSRTLVVMLWWVRIEYIAITCLSIAWLWFTLDYAGYSARVMRRTLPWLCIIPALTIIIHWTNPWHHLYYTEVGIITTGPFPLLDIVRGPWYWVWVCYFYLTFVVGTLILALVWVRSTPLYRDQTLIILLGAALPWATNIAYMAGFRPFGSLDLTPYAFAGTGVAATWGLFRHRLLELGPIARHRVVESLADSVFILDDDTRVIDLNPAAEKLCGLPAAQVIGHSLLSRLPEHHDLTRQLTDAVEAHTQIDLPVNGKPRCFELTISPIHTRNSKQMGRLVVLHDVTERIQAEEDLRRAKVLAEERSQAAEAANRARSVFLANVSHELRTPLHAIVGFSEILQSADNLEPEQHSGVATIHESAVHLLQLINSILELTVVATDGENGTDEWEIPSAQAVQVRSNAQKPNAVPETTLPQTWLAALRKATVEGDVVGLRSLAREIRDHDADLSDQLTRWIDEFAYEQILVFSQSDS